MTRQVDFARRKKMNELLNAVGITSLPPGVDPNDITKKILADAFVGNCVFALLIKQFAAEAMAERHTLEKESLRKRLGLEQAPKPNVEWAVGTNPVNGKTMVIAKCAGETMYFDGSPEAISRQKFRGETCPPDIATLYRLHVGNGNDPELEAVRRDYGERELAKVKHANYEHKTKDIIG
jgi:hypothetical protein